MPGQTGKPSLEPQPGDILFQPKSMRTAIFRDKAHGWWLAVETNVDAHGGGEMAHLRPDIDIAVINLVSDVETKPGGDDLAIQSVSGDSPGLLRSVFVEVTDKPPILPQTLTAFEISGPLAAALDDLFPAV